MLDEDEKALIWLYACTDLDDRTRRQLLRAAKSPKNLFSAFEKYLSSVIKEGERRVYKSKSLSERERQIEKFLACLQEKGYFALTFFSEDYPASLKAIHDPPLVLYGAGNRELLKRRKFTIVGSRITPPFAEKLGKRISSELSRHFAVVTGLAEGGDVAAICGALQEGVICVLPNGLDECYPAAHASLKAEIRKRGLLLTEYTPSEKVRKYSFHARNRILAGLSEGTLVLSAGERSGALITANQALENGRDVFALPYNAGISQGVGCNELIKHGAYLCTDAEDILTCYGFSAQKAQKPALSDGEEKLLALLKESGELHTAVIAERSGLKVHEVAATLSSLEIKGLVVKAGGNRFSAV